MDNTRQWRVFFIRLLAQETLRSYGVYSDCMMSNEANLQHGYMEMLMFRKLAIILIFIPFMASADSLVDLSFTNSIYMVHGAELRHAAELGDVDSQFQLGWQYSQRDHRERLSTIKYNPRLALRWYRQAASQGHAPSAYNLAVIYAQGRGIAADPIEAYAWLDYAADAGHKPSKNLLTDFERVLNERQIQAGLDRQGELLPARLLYN